MGEFQAPTGLLRYWKAKITTDLFDEKMCKENNAHCPDNFKTFENREFSLNNGGMIFTQKIGLSAYHDKRQILSDLSRSKYIYGYVCI